MTTEKKIKIIQVRSTIGKLEPQKRTMKALGLTKPHMSVIQSATPAIRGMVAAVKHLVKVEDV